jgi:DNA replication protein DnaC
VRGRCQQRSYEQYLLHLTELEVAARSSNAVQARIRNAGFPVLKDFDTFDFMHRAESLNKPKVLENAHEHRSSSLSARVSSRSLRWLDLPGWQPPIAGPPELL